MKRIIIVAILALAVIFPSTAKAQTTDPRCFTKSECLDARRNAGVDERDAAAGFYSSADNNDALLACDEKNFRNEEMGFCLPSSVARTKITIGGRNEFQSIGEFIELFYQYGIGLIGLFSIIMIIIAGAQWITSGGSPDRVSAAKKRIAGAITGLILAVFSYTILNTISPNLLRFRLPQVWMVNSFDASANLCGDLVEPGVPAPALALVTRSIGPSTPSAQINSILEDAFNAGTKQPTDPDLGCGPEYFVADTGGQTCIANRCPNANEICVKGGDPTLPDEYACVPGNIIATVRNSAVGAGGIVSTLTQDNGWSWSNAVPGQVAGWVNASQSLFNGLCSDGDSFFAVSNPRLNPDPANAQKQEQNLIFTKISALTASTPAATRTKVENYITSRCGSVNDFLGFHFLLPFNESLRPTYETHAIGKNGIDLGAVLLVGEGKFEERTRLNQITPSQLYSIDDYIDFFGINVTIDAARVIDEDD